MTNTNNGIIVENIRKGSVEMEKQYFTIEEALSDIQEVLESGYDGYVCDLHNEVFNTDYYIIGTYKAKQALTQYGVFEAIEEVMDYENFNFGQVYTELHNPEKLANMLYHIKGKEAINLLVGSVDGEDVWNEQVTDELRQLMIEAIDELI